jgi:hypothetical protein
MLTFEEGVDSTKCSEGLGFNHFYVLSPCNPLIEDYTEIFYMTDEGDVPSIQCKMSLRGPKCMRKVDGLRSLDSQWSPLYRLDANSMENTASNSSSIVVCICCCGRGFTELLPSNRRLFCSSIPAFRHHVTIFSGDQLDHG